MAGNAALQLRDQTLSRSAEPELRLSLAKRPSEAQNPREDPSPRQSTWNVWVGITA